MRLAEKVSIITGAGAGMGRAAVHRFAREGSRVVAVDIDEAAGRETASKAAESGGDVTFIACDITDAGSVRSMVSAAVAAYDGIDILYNNAGSSHGVFGPLHTLDEDGFDRVMRTNIRGTFICSKYVIPTMLEKGRGSIINVGSAVGLVGWEGGAALCTAKGGVVLMTKAMALDYAESGIRVNCLCPGSTLTAQTESRLKDADDPDAVIAPLIKKHAMRRLADADEIVNAALFLASDEASFVTGAAFSVDGGWTT